MSRSGEEQQCKACTAGESVACWRTLEASASQVPWEMGGQGPRQAGLVNQGLDVTLRVTGRLHGVEG